MSKVYEFVGTSRIMFGIGAADNIARYLDMVGAKRPVIVADKFLKDSGAIKLICDPLDAAGIDYDVFTDISPNPTTENAIVCYQMMKEGNYQSVIAFGGGSVMDVAKAAALLMTNPEPLSQYVGVGKVPNAPLPIITVPTTAGTGSEVSNISILKDVETGVKGGIVDPIIFPALSIVDPRATFTLPRRLTAATGMDAFTHAVEGYMSLKTTPFTDIYYEKAIALISQNLRAAVANGADEEARSNMALAATIAGIGMGVASTCAGHAMSYGLEHKYVGNHGESVAALLPAVMTLNVPAVPKRLRKVAELMGENVEGLNDQQAAQVAIDAVRQLSRDVRIPTVRDLGMTEADVDEFAEIAFNNKRLMGNNPWVVTLEDVKATYRLALSY